MNSEQSTHQDAPTKLKPHLKIKAFFRKELNVDSKTLQRQSIKRIEANRWNNKGVNGDAEDDLFDFLGSNQPEKIHFRRFINALGSSRTNRGLHIDFSTLATNMLKGSFKDMIIREKHLLEVRETFKKLFCLQDLTLDFSKCKEISDPGSWALKRTLQVLPGLQNLRIDFPK